MSNVEFEIHRDSSDLESPEIGQYGHEWTRHEIYMLCSVYDIELCLYKPLLHNASREI